MPKINVKMNWIADLYMILEINKIKKLKRKNLGNQSNLRNQHLICVVTKDAQYVSGMNIMIF